MRFGARLREERVRRHLSQEALAEALALSARSIRRWERGQAVPQASVRLQLSRFFGVRLEELFEEQETQTTRTSLWCVPFLRNPFFTGREEMLMTLHAALSAKQQNSFPQSYALLGLSGVGKTQIALEYAYRYAWEYRAVFWIRSETTESIRVSLLQAAEVLELPGREEKDQQSVIAAVKRWLTTHDQWLLICDNVEDLGLLDSLLSDIRVGALLLTTQRQTLGTRAQGISLLPMEQEEGMLLLLRRAKVLPAEATSEQVRQLAVRMRSTYRAAAELVKVTGGLPLALDQAGAYVEETQCGLPAYLNLFYTRQTALLSQRGDGVHPHPMSVSTTFTLAITATTQHHPAVRDLLSVCALLQPEIIPEELFRQGAEYLGAELEAACRDVLDWNRVVAVTCSYSLLSRQAEAETFSIHRLVQAALLDTMTGGERQTWTQRVIRALDAVFPALNALYPEVLPTGDYAVWKKQCERLVAHVLHTFYRVEDEADSLALASVAFKAAQYLHQRGQYTEAEPLLQRALHIRELALSSDHPWVGVTLNELANIYLKQGRYAEAEPLLLRALDIRERISDLNHLDVAITLNDLAILYWRQGRYAKVEPLYQRALVHCKQAQNPEILLESDLYNHLAVLYWSQGRYVEAEPLYQRSLHICEQALGPDHLYISYSLNNLGDLYRTQRWYTEAETLYQRALNIREQVLGPNHPDVATILSNLAELARLQNKYKEAKILYQRALSIREQAQGSGHPLVAMSLNGLANLLRDQGRYTEAEALYQQALSIREQQLGQQHPDTAQTLHDLSLSSLKQGDLSRALALAKRVLVIYSSSLGDAHPKTVTIHALYAQLVQEQGKGKSRGSTISGDTAFSDADVIPSEPF